MVPLNPYVVGNPVGGSPAFVGRADVLREVLRVLRRPQDNAVVLYGQRRIGKTSILQHLEAGLPEEGAYRPVYFDLQDKADWPLDRVLQAIARKVAHTLDRTEPDLGPDPGIGFRRRWLPAVLDDLPNGCSLVFLFDEFDVLAAPQAEQAATAFFPYLRGLLASDPRRLQFIFVIGRNVDDLDNIALSLFRGTPYQRVSLLHRDDTADLVRLSQTNRTLRWPDEAVERIWQWARGHPFLTQQLCSHVWERAYDEEEAMAGGPSPVAPEDIDSAVPDVLSASRNTLEWLWDGLPTAERVVASVLAEAGPGPITQDALERLLHESGVRVVIQELQDAPQLLQDWDLIEPTDGGYRFRVELLRRWIADHKPLRRVQEELDRIEPVAQNLYRAALGLYQAGQLDQVVGLLRQAIGLNPNHVGASQLLAEILLSQGQPDEARQLLERLYEYQPAAARPRLVQALLAKAQVVKDDDAQLALYNRVLELNPVHREARAGRRRVWQQRGDTALAQGDVESAVRAYREAGLADKKVRKETEVAGEAAESGWQARIIVSVVHELRTPMTSITGYTDLLLSESVGIISEMQRQFLQRIRANIEPMAVMLNDLIGAAAKEVEFRWQAEMIAAVVRELRMPMTSVTAYTDLLLGELVGTISDLQRRFLERIKANVERMRAMLDNLIGLTAIDSGQLRLESELVDAGSTIQEAIIGARDQLEEKDISLYLDLEPDIGIIEVDPNALRQIVGNLINNACKASPVGGEIRIEAGYEREKQVVGPTWLVVSVTDSGGGIALEDQPRVFDRFYEAGSPLIAGLGETSIGLSVAKTLIEAHAGRIWVESEPGKGSTIRFSLPVAGEKTLD